MSGGEEHLCLESTNVTLSDGRKLGYTDYGSADGKPLFYFHGTPSSRIEWQMFGGEQLATQLNLRVISMDRPGMGLSDFQQGRRLLDWPTDIVAFADALSIDHFAVLVFSGAGPMLPCAPWPFRNALRLSGSSVALGPFLK